MQDIFSDNGSIPGIGSAPAKLVSNSAPVPVQYTPNSVDHVIQDLIQHPVHHGH
jgi:hypothetical protein